MNTFLYIWLAIIIIFIIWALRNFKKSNKNEIIPYKCDNTIVWDVTTLILYEKINAWREKNGCKWVFPCDDMVMLARTRVDYWIKNDIKASELHSLFGIHRTPYFDLGLLKIAENASYGYENTIFEKWKASEAHNKNMLNSEWKYIGIDVRKNKQGITLACLILAK